MATVGLSSIRYSYWHKGGVIQNTLISSGRVLSKSTFYLNKRPSAVAENNSNGTL